MFSRQVLRAARVAAPQRALALRAAPVRSFAAAASTEVKPPISVFGVDGTYATALVYTAAVKTSSIDAAADALNRLGALIEKDPKLAAVLSAPTLTAADKKAIVQELEKQINTKDETVKNFLATLAENNRLGLIPGVVEKFSSIISAARGEVELTVTSAQVRLWIYQSTWIGSGKLRHSISILGIRQGWMNRWISWHGT
ncbi:ATP synthase subunit 5 [Fusarium oxysporum f. sp. phaseoli]